MALPPRRLPADADLDAACIAAALWSRAQRRAAARVLATIPGGFRNSIMPPDIVDYRVATANRRIAYRIRRDGGFDVEANGRPLQATVRSADATGIDLVLDGLHQSFRVTARGDRLFLHGPAGDLDITEQPRHPPPARADNGGGLRAPMPGRVIAVQVADGAPVLRGQVLLVLEAMKMEHRITAPADGIVTRLHVAAGDQVANGALLVVLETTETNP